MAEYKNLLDQSVELYRFKDRVKQMEKKEESSKAKVIRMENILREKSAEVKKLQFKVKYYEKEREKQKSQRTENVRLDSSGMKKSCKVDLFNVTYFIFSSTNKLKF